MRLLPALSRTRVTALATGLAATAALAVGAPASATAQADVTATLRVTVTDGDSVTLRVTVTDGDSVMTQTAGQYTCHSGFSVGQAKGISVTVPAGQWVQVFSSHGCYDAITISGTYVETDGQVITFTL